MRGQSSAAGWRRTESRVTYCSPRTSRTSYPQIQPFIEKLESAARRRVIIDELTVPPPNQSAGCFRLVYGEDELFVPGPDELLPVLEEMGITPEVIHIGSAANRRPLPQTREEAIKNELGLGWVRPDDVDRARSLFNEHFDEIFVETPQGFARREAEGVRELMITWEPKARGSA